MEPVVSAMVLEKSEVTAWSRDRFGEKGDKDVGRCHLKPSFGKLRIFSNLSTLFILKTPPV